MGVATIFWHIPSERLADVNLPRTTNSSRFSRADFAIICDPTWDTADSEDDGKHLRRDPDRAHHDAAIEIHVGIKFHNLRFQVVVGVRHREHHVQKIRRVLVLRLGIDEGQPA